MCVLFAWLHADMTRKKSKDISPLLKLYEEFSEAKHMGMRHLTASKIKGGRNMTRGGIENHIFNHRGLIKAVWGPYKSYRGHISL